MEKNQTPDSVVQAQGMKKYPSQDLTSAVVPWDVDLPVPCQLMDEEDQNASRRDSNEVAFWCKGTKGEGATQRLWAKDGAGADIA